MIRVLPLFSLLMLGWLLSSCGASATPDPDDPAHQSAWQVVGTFLRAYQSGDDATCMALLAPDLRASLPSPDAFARTAATRRTDFGVPVRWTIENFSDDGAFAHAYITLIHEPPVPSPDTISLDLKRMAGLWQISAYGW